MAYRTANRYFAPTMAVRRSRPLHDRDYAIVVQVLSDMRREQGVTQVELAKRLGVDQSLVSKVERKERRVDIVELRRVCVALGTSLSAFVGRFERALATKGGQ